MARFTRSKLYVALGLLYSSAIFADATEKYEQALTAYYQDASDIASLYLKEALTDDPNHIPSRLLLGKVYFEQGVFAAAEDQLNRALSLGADVNLVVPTLARSLLLQRDLEQLSSLQSYYGQLSEENRYEWHLIQGQRALLEQDLNAAESELLTAKEMVKDDVRALNSLANIYLKRKQQGDAEQLIQQSLEIDSENPKTAILQGDLATLRDEKQTALEFYRIAYDASQQDPITARKMISALIAVDQLDEAQAITDLSLKSLPFDINLLITKAYLLIQTGGDEEAQLILDDLSNRLSQANSYQSSRNERYNKIKLVHALTEHLKGNVQQSQRLLTQHLSLVPDDIYALQLLAKAYMLDNKSNQAETLLLNNLSLVESDRKLTTLLLNILLRDSNLVRARLVLDSARESFPESGFFVEEAQFSAMAGQLSTAIEWLDRLPQNDQTLMIKAKLLIESGAASKANDIITKLKLKHPQNADILNLHCAYLMKTGQLTEALTQADTILEFAGDNIDARFNRISILIALTKYSPAIDDLESILLDQPDNLEASKRLALTYFMTGQADKAELILDKAIIHHPDDNQLVHAKLKRLMDSRRLKEAQSLITEQLKQDPFNDLLLLNQGIVFNELGDKTRARQSFGVVYGLWSEFPNKLTELAKHEMQSGLWPEAQQAINKALSLAPKNPQALLAQAQINVTSGDMDGFNRVTKQLKSVLKSVEHADNLNSRLSLLQGNAATLEKNYAQAGRYLSEAIRLDNSNHLAVYGLYQLTMQNLIGNEFFSSIEKYYANNPPAPVRKLLADASLTQGKIDIAQQHYEQLLNTAEYQSHPMVLNNLANIYIQSDLAKAEKTISLAAEVDPQNPVIFDTYGWILSLAQRPSEALGKLRKAYTLDAGSAEINYHLGQVLLQLDRKAEAKTHLRTAANAEGFSQRQQAQKTLAELN